MCISSNVFSAHEIKYFWYLPKKKKFFFSIFSLNFFLVISRLSLFSSARLVDIILGLENGLKCHFNE